VQVENIKKKFSFTKTSFLNLMLAIERTLQMYKQLKEYFELIEFQTFKKKFYENLNEEVWFWFVHNNSFLFHLAFFQIVGNKISATEALLEYFYLLNT